MKIYSSVVLIIVQLSAASFLVEARLAKRSVALQDSSSDWISAMDGLWGDWQDPVTFEDDLIRGIAVRTEYPGCGDDCTGVNGIMLSMLNGSSLNICQGVWGTWNNFLTDLTQRWYACGIRVKWLKYQGEDIDDLALTAVQLRFCDGSGQGLHQIDQVISDQDANIPGDWQDWVTDNYKKICGMQVQFEPPQGDNDDAAMNGIRVKFCG